MTHNLYLYKFNNYYNRTVKRFNDISDYEEFRIGEVLTNINFIPADGIWTEQIINWNNPIPDYLIAQNIKTNELSRWFVIESVRTRNGQFKLTLRRDILAENIDLILDAPTFVEKATVALDDPALFNPEGIAVNQIKQSEVFLKDSTNMPWIVAYIAKHDATIEDISAEGWEDKEITVPSSKVEYNITRNSIDELKAEVEKSFINDYEIQVDTKVEVGNRDQYRRLTFKRNDGVKNLSQTVKSSLTSYFNTEASSLSSLTFDIIESGVSRDYSLTSPEIENSIRSLNGLNVKIGNEIYNISINEEILPLQPIDPVANTTNLYLGSKNALNAVPSGNSGNIIDILSINAKKYILTLNQAIGKASKFKISKTREQLKDAPYDMIAFPYPINQEDEGAGIDHFEIDGDAYTQDAKAAFAVASKLSSTWGSSVVYDVQILPFCPCRDLLPSGSSTLSLNSVQNLGRYDTIKDDDDNIIGIAIYCVSSSGTFNINYSMPAATSKVDIMTNKYRLCDSTFSNAYELDVYENGGIDYFNVDFTYLPYQPWIKINPNFKYLNGNDTNDARGLIMGGNFSISRTNNAWADYQLNNINYENIFNRQVKNMKLNQKVEKINQIGSILTGSVSGSASGAVSGFTMGGGPGSIAGATIGGIAGIGGGIADLYYGNKLRTEALNYTKDMYNYNLQNIQALPETIAKLTAFNINSKYFPYIEYYTCTDIEKEAVRNKLKYNGMSVGRIDNLRNFLSNTDELQYMKGSIIRIDDIFEDFNYAKEISDEVFKGFFIKEGDI